MKCQHGPAECRLNRVINCAQALHPEQGHWLPFVRCLESSRPFEMEKQVERCAQDTGIAADALQACATGGRCPGGRQPQGCTAHRRGGVLRPAVKWESGELRDAAAGWEDPGLAAREARPPVTPGSSLDPRAVATLPAAAVQACRVMSWSARRPRRPLRCAHPTRTCPGCW